MLGGEAVGSSSIWPRMRRSRPVVRPERTEATSAARALREAPASCQVRTETWAATKVGEVVETGAGGGLGSVLVRDCVGRRLRGEPP